MSLEWEQVVVDAVDPVMLGRWWADALGWVVVNDHPDEFEIQPEVDRLPGLIFEPVGEAKSGKNRLHLDFRPVDQEAEVARLLSLGARHTDIGQGQQSWVVLADPEGNEFCVLSSKKGPPQPNGIDVELLATVDLGPEIKGLDGLQLRMRIVTMQPGAVFGPVHDHKGRPGTVYVLQGTITDHRDGTTTDYGPGLGWPEDRNTVHWLENRGEVPAIEISVDVVREDPSGEH